MHLLQSMLAPHEARQWLGRLWLHDRLQAMKLQRRIDHWATCLLVVAWRVCEAPWRAGGAPRSEFS